MIDVLRRQAEASACAAANIFPLMPDGELNVLAEDIKAHGLREPIWRDGQGVIVDGRNRWIACQMVGVDCKALKYEGSSKEMLAFILSHNLHRRHLNESQRGIVAGKIANLPHGINQYSADGPMGTSSAPTVAEAAAMLNVGERSVKRARSVIRDAPADVVKQVEKGEISLRAAERAAKAEAAKRNPPKPSKPRKPRKPKAADETVVPARITQLRMWIRTGTWRVAEFDSGEDAADAAMACGAPLYTDELLKIESFVDGMLAATRAVRAA